MLHPDEITGVVLAGGKSSRFGSNKALSKYGDETFLKHITALLQPYAKEVVISGSYPEYESFGAAVLEDKISETGPLGGIYTALLYSSTPWILVLTCDMPFITNEIIMHMLAAGKGENVIGWNHAENIGIFPLMVSKNALPDIEKAIEKKQYRIKQIFNRENTRRITIPDQWEHFFANINSQEDYKNTIK